MGKQFLLPFLILSSLFMILHHGSDAESEPGPDIQRIPAAALLRYLKPATNVAGLPTEKADGGEREVTAEAPSLSDGGKWERHHSAEKSMAGGEVIIGGLATAIFAAVYCYIRVTRKRPIAEGM